MLYLSLAKHTTRDRARFGCLDRSARCVYNVARCGRHDGGRNRVFGQSRYVTCVLRETESDATEKTRVIARDEMAVGRHAVIEPEVERSTEKALSRSLRLCCPLKELFCPKHLARS